MKKLHKVFLSALICFALLAGAAGAGAAATQETNTIVIEFSADAGAPIGVSPPSYEVVDLLYTFDNVTNVEDVIVNEWTVNKSITANAPCTITYVGVKDNKELDPNFDPFLICTDIESGEDYWAGGYENPEECVITLDKGEYDIFVGNFGKGTTHRLIVGDAVDGGTVDVEPDIADMANIADIVGMPSTASPTVSTVLVNGKNVAFDAYTINDNNYFKLRDLAYVLSGSEKQFEVGWDEEADAISLTSGITYTQVGGELAAGNAGDKDAYTTTSRIFLNEAEVKFAAYNIDGNNYFKLRDIGGAFDFGVDWDEANNTIAINTDKGYSD